MVFFVVDLLVDLLVVVGLNVVGMVVVGLVVVGGFVVVEGLVVCPFLVVVLVVFLVVSLGTLFVAFDTVVDFLAFSFMPLFMTLESTDDEFLLLVSVSFLDLYPFRNCIRSDSVIAEFSLLDITYVDLGF